MPVPIHALLLRRFHHSDSNCSPRHGISGCIVSVLHTYLMLPDLLYAPFHTFLPLCVAYRCSSLTRSHLYKGLIRSTLMCMSHVSIIKASAFINCFLVSMPYVAGYRYTKQISIDGQSYAGSIGYSWDSTHRTMFESSVLEHAAYVVTFYTCVAIAVRASGENPIRGRARVFRLHAIRIQSAQTLIRVKTTL